MVQNFIGYVRCCFVAFCVKMHSVSGLKRFKLIRFKIFNDYTKSLIRMYHRKYKIFRYLSCTKNSF